MGNEVEVSAQYAIFAVALSQLLRRTSLRFPNMWHNLNDTFHRIEKGLEAHAQQCPDFAGGLYTVLRELHIPPNLDRVFEDKLLKAYSGAGCCLVSDEVSNWVLVILIDSRKATLISKSLFTRGEDDLVDQKTRYILHGPEGFDDQSFSTGAPSISQ